MKPNLLLATDAYKGSHSRLFPPNADAARYYLAPRKPIAPELREFLFFGVTAFIHDYLDNVLTRDDIQEARAIWDHFNVGGTPYPFPFAPFENLVELHGKNYKYPINIYGVPEGTVTDRYNEPLLIVECLRPDFLFLPGFLETALQRDVWYGSTVATNSRNVRAFLEDLYADTVEADDYWTLDYRLHDFGARGATSGLSAANGGLAHLINFRGTDTMEGVRRGVELYNAAPDELAASIPAAEHSTVTAWGEGLAAEKAALKHMLETYGPENPLLAFVSDSYDYKRMVDEGWGDPEIQALARKHNVTPVVRPDSGDPVEMVLYALRGLEQTWGVNTNAKGYKVLDGVNVIQGDGMDYDKIRRLYGAVVEAGFSPQNLVVGMGGGLLQKLNRDTMSWSMKMYGVRVDGEWRNVQKTPVTQKEKTAWDPGAGLNTDGWVTYYRGDAERATYDFPDYARDFDAVRKRARHRIAVAV